MINFNTIECSVADRLVELKFNRPNQGNAMSIEWARELAEAVNFIGTHPDVGAILLSGAGPQFSVGGDIGLFTTRVEEMPDVVQELTLYVHAAMARLLRLDAPIVAAVQGVAAGGAVSMIANCDLVIAGRSASFHAAYSKIGLACDLGGTFGLASRMGLARARRFILLGESMDAGSAHSAGLVDELVDDAELMSRARQVADRLAAGPTRAYGEIRRLMARSFGQPFEAQIEDEAQAMFRTASTDDAREGIMAFAEKRKPRFTGR